jgi:nicotinamidase-related amidase
MTFALWTIGTIVAALALYILLGIYRLLTPTRGERIDRSSRAGEALVVIDLQSDFTRKTGTKGYDPARVETTLSMVNALARRAHEEGVPVVAIRQVVTAPLAAFIGRFLAGPEGFIGSPGIGLDPRLDIKADRDFTKDRGDAFSSLAFEAWLGERKIGKLRIVGLDGCYCVRLTSMGALSRGYAVELIESGVLVSDARRWTECKTELSRRGASFAAA